MKQEILKFARKGVDEIAKHSPSLLTGFGVAGIFVTAYLTAKATLKAKEKLDKLPEDADTIDKLKEAAPCYIAPALTAVASAAAIIGANTVNQRRQALAATAYSMSEAARQEFQDKATEIFGEKKVEKAKDQIAEDKVRKYYDINKDHIIETGYGNQIFIDMWNGQVFKSDIERIRRAVNDANEEMISGVNVFLNDLYEPWGINQTKSGEIFGWDINFNGTIKLKTVPIWLDEERGITATGLDFYNEPTLVTYD